MIATESAAISDSWLHRPWAGAMMRCIADPAADFDDAIAKDWPEWLPRDPARADSFIRMRLGSRLLRDQDRGASAIISAGHAPRTRLAFLPVSDAVRLMCLAAAWTGVPSLVGQLRNADVVAARSVLGEDAFAFAFDAALLPRPTAGLMSAIGASKLPTGPAELLHCAAAMFGLAMGCIPHALQVRLRLRSPASIWTVSANACRNDSAGEDAFHAMRRLVRKRMAPWSHWFD
ncbi:hypothetical protein [Bradyrhizobium mercantei]|uniref:hypothetical protein n=1 Tax=Bradyrhizobium mercantei TaxID=1904807 RepID=UPI00097633C4|nr:hypothetical protein [Bradyrhizobium mercantei]